MSDGRRKSLIVGNLPEETVAALKDATMSDDIVKRLREDARGLSFHGLSEEAADTIERLSAEAENTVPKEFNDANIRVAREFKARAEAAKARLAPLRAALEHIRIVCEDNEACDLLGLSLALRFVLGIAERALRQPASET